MVGCRGLGWLLCIVCVAPSGLDLGACTQSHDVDAIERPLVSGVDGEVDVVAGREAAGSSGVTAQAGAGGRAGGLGRAGTGASGASEPCGASCAAGSLLGTMLPACCTSDDKCGLDLSAFGSTSCVEKNAPGSIDTSCPDRSFALFALPGCCRSDGICGGMDTSVGLGCTTDPAAPIVTCTPP
jgi:hypothetical protein